MTSKNYFFESNYTFRPLISITAAIIMSQMLLNCDNGRMFADLSMLVSTDKKRRRVKINCHNLVSKSATHKCFLLKIMRSYTS